MLSEQDVYNALICLAMFVHYVILRVATTKDSQWESQHINQVLVRRQTYYCCSMIFSASSEGNICWIFKSESIHLGAWSIGVFQPCPQSLRLHIWSQYFMLERKVFFFLVFSKAHRDF